MNLPKDIILEVLYFLDWEGFYKVIEYLKYDIPKQLIRYDKYNNLLKNLEICDICKNSIEYLEIVKYLHSIGKECTTFAMDEASFNEHLEIVKYLHSIGKECTTSAMNWASSNGHLEIVEFLKTI
jgi:serine/threonine protein kinase